MLAAPATAQRLPSDRVEYYDSIDTKPRQLSSSEVASLAEELARLVGPFAITELASGSLSGNSLVDFTLGAAGDAQIRHQVFVRSRADAEQLDNIVLYSRVASRAGREIVAELQLYYRAGALSMTDAVNEKFGRLIVVLRAREHSERNAIGFAIVQVQYEDREYALRYARTDSDGWRAIKTKKAGQ